MNPATDNPQLDSDQPTVNPWAHKPTLSGDRVELRPFRADDLPAIAECIADPEVLKLTGSVQTTAEAADVSVEVDQRLRDWYLSRNDQDDRLDLAVVDRATDACVGEVVLNELDRDNGNCNFRTLIGPRGRDRGLGSEATRLIVDHGFGALGLHRISLDVYDFNPRAQRAYEKAGFVLEGRLRDEFRFDDGWHDSILMAMLYDEWVAARA
ncbi:MAG: GNAT family N-acetyltransferase [Propionibacteriaceae bacterium]